MKKKLLFLLITILAVALCCTACSRDEEIPELTIKSIAVVENTVPTTINIGKEPDFSGIKVIVTYSDDSTKEIGYADVTLGTIDTTTKGEKTVTVTYGDAHTSFKVTVVDPEDSAYVTAIRIVPGTLITSYYIGQAPDYSTLQVEATYSTGRVGPLKISDYAYTTIDTSTAGDKTFTVTYAGDNSITATATIKVTDIASMNVVTNTVKNKIFIGETLDTSTIQLEVTYADETTEIVEGALLTVGTVDTTTHGKKTLAITYKGVTYQYPVEVVGPVELKINPGSYTDKVLYKNAYSVGAVTGLLKYSDGTEAALKTLDLAIGTIDTTTVGTKQLKITCTKYGVTLEAKVDVSVVGVQSMNVVTGTLASEIFKGEALNTANIKVAVTYTETIEGAPTELSLNQLTLGTIDKDTAGVQNLSIAYLDKTIQVPVKVCTVKSLRVTGIPSSIFVGGDVDLDDMIVEMVYDNTAGKKVPLTTGYTTNIGDLVFTTPGKKTLVVTYTSSEYGTVTGSVDIQVNVAKLTGITVQNGYDKLIGINESYNADKIKVKATYEDGNEHEVTGFTVSGISTSAAGEVTFTVSYTEGGVTKTATGTYKVLPITGLAVNGLANKIYYGGTLNTAGVSVNVTYGEGAEALTRTEITTGITYGTFNNQNVETQSIKVTYGGFDTYVNVTVVGVESMTVTGGIVDAILKTDSLVTSGATVHVVYTDGTDDNLNADALTIGTIDTTTVGEKDLEITYLDKTITHKVRVCEIESISVSGISTVLQSGVRIDLSNMVVTGYYDNGSKTIVLLAPGTPNEKVSTNVGEINFNTEDDKILRVTYNGVYGNKSLDITISATPPALTGITILNGYDKLIGIGETYDESKIKIEATYGNGNTDDTVTGFTITGITTNVAGEVTFTVSYTEGGETKTATGTYKVLPVKSITVNGIANKVYYGSGALNTDQVSLNVIYGDDTDTLPTRTGITTGITINKADFNDKLVGDQTIVVTYKEFSTNYTVKVVGVQSMSVVAGTLATEILDINLAGFTTDGVQVSVTYTDGTTATLKKNDLIVSDLMDGKVKITYLDKFIEHDVKVCVISGINAYGIASQIYTDGKLKLTNLKVYGVYNDTNETETAEPLQITNVTTDRGDLILSVAGDKTLTVTYDGAEGNFTTTVSFKVVDPALKSIEVVDFIKLIGVGQTYDQTQIKVEGYYEDGKYRDIKGFDVTGISTNAAGDITFTVSYGSMNATATYKVLPVSSATVSGIAGAVNRGETLDTSKATITVTYADTEGNSITSIYKENVVVSGTVDTSSATSLNAPRELTVSYNGVNVTAKYHVTAVESIRILDGTVNNRIRYGYGVVYDGLVLEITYSNGYVEHKAYADLSGASVSGEGVGSPTFKVTYQEKTASLALTVVYAKRIHALNGTIPGNVYAEPNGILSYENFRISVYYPGATKNDPDDVYLIPLNDPFIVKLTPAYGQFSLTDAGYKAIDIVFSDGGSDAFPDDPSNPGTIGLQPFTTSVNIHVIGVSKVEIVDGTVLDFAILDQTNYDTSNLSVKVTFDDESYVYIDNTNPYLEITPPDTSKEGPATLTVKYKGVAATKEVTVKRKATLSGAILGALLPDELVARDSYKKTFLDGSSEYRVGDDNPYKLDLIGVGLDDNDEMVTGVVQTNAKIYLLDGSNEMLLTDEYYVKFNSGDNTYDFTEHAVGKRFRLEVSPVGSIDPSMTKKHTVTVVDGWNVYSAKELNLVTNVTHEVTDDYYTELGISGPINQYEVAKAFLVKNGINVDPNSVWGIVLHGNIDVKIEDLPPEYFYEYKDPKTGLMTKGLYDQLGVFNRGLTWTNREFNIYGNYYSIYSYNLPCVTPKGIGNNPDEYSSSDLFRIKGYYSYMGGDYYHLYTDLNKYGVPAEVAADPNRMLFDQFKANIRDLSTRDNDPNSNDQTASERHMRGLICYKVGENVTTLTNVNVEAFQMSMCVEHSNSTLNLDHTKLYNAWQGHLFLWNDNRYQLSVYGANAEDVETQAYARDVVVNIKDSSLTKCGGPVILAQHAGLEDSGDYRACNNTLGVRVIADVDSKIETNVTGQEAWFVAVNQTALASQIKAMSPLIGKHMTAVVSSAGFLTDQKIQGVWTVNMMMVNMGTGATISGTTTYNGSFVRVDDNGNVVTTGMKMGRPGITNANFYNPYVDAYKAVGAPIFQSSAGGTAFTDGQSGCYISAALDKPGDSFYAGDYISLYYMGVGIMMEYYN